MAEYNLQLRGWHALIAIPLVLGFWGMEMYLRVRPVDDAMRDAVRAELLNEYSGRGPKDVARIVAEARAGSPVEPVQPLVQRISGSETRWSRSAGSAASCTSSREKPPGAKRM